MYSNHQVTPFTQTTAHHSNSTATHMNHNPSNSITISTASTSLNSSPIQYRISQKYMSSNSSQQQQLSSNKNLSHVPCKFFRQGACQAGDSCPFSHSLDDFDSLSKQPCKYYMKGNCKFGMKCALGHYLPDGRRVNNFSLKHNLRNHNNNNNNVSPQSNTTKYNNSFKNNNNYIAQTPTPRYGSAPSYSSTSYVSSTPSSSALTSSSSTDSTTFSSNSVSSRTPLAIYTKHPSTTTPTSNAQQFAHSPSSSLSSPAHYGTSMVFSNNSAASTPTAANTFGKMTNPLFDGSAIYDEDEREDAASSCGSTASYSANNSIDFSSQKMNQAINNHYNTLMQNSAAMMMNSGSRRASSTSSSGGGMGFLNGNQFNNKLVTIMRPDQQMFADNNGESDNKFPVLRSMSSSSQNNDFFKNFNMTSGGSNNSTISSPRIYCETRGPNATFLQPFTNSAMTNVNSPPMLTNGPSGNSYIGMGTINDNSEYFTRRSSSFGDDVSIAANKANAAWPSNTTDARKTVRRNYDDDNSNNNSVGYDTMFYIDSSSSSSKFPSKLVGSANEDDEDRENDEDEEVDFIGGFSEGNNDYFDLVPSMLGNLLTSQESEQ